jgi:ubiquitin carboxyl-terminal hydrolase 14
MIVGAAGELPKPPAEPIKFLEDMDDTELADAVGPMSLIRFSFLIRDLAWDACRSHKVRSYTFDHLARSDVPCALSLGNTCYMSATVQAMRAIPELQAALSEFVTPYLSVCHT